MTSLNTSTRRTTNRRTASPPPLAFQRLNEAFADLTEGGRKTKTSDVAIEEKGPSVTSILHMKDVEVVSDVGKRPYMEDVSLTLKVNDRFYCAFVFDGHNGSRASTYLRDALSKYLPKLLTKDVDGALIPSVLRNIFDKLGKDFKKKKWIDGSTIAGIIIDLFSGVFHVITLGDSQTLIMGLQGKVNYISHRDSTDILEERQRVARSGFKIEKENAAAMWRLYGLNMTKAFGNYHTDKLDEALQKTNGRMPHIHTMELPKTQQNATILIASDGLFDEVSPEHIADVPLLRKMTPTRLLSVVMADGFKGDNCTIVKLVVSRK